jgi:hypothetical protein
MGIMRWLNKNFELCHNKALANFAQKQAYQFTQLNDLRGKMREF